LKAVAGNRGGKNALIVNGDYCVNRRFCCVLNDRISCELWLVEWELKDATRCITCGRVPSIGSDSYLNPEASSRL
jgi:hypothetical protein